MIIVPLEKENKWQSASPRYVVVREICGAEEMSDLLPVQLISRLIVDGTVSPNELNLSEQDRVLAEIYRSIYGNRIECVTVCDSCGREFEVSFALNDWIDSLCDVAGPVAIRCADGVFELDANEEHPALRFRLPTEATIRSVASWDTGETVAMLRRNCVVGGDPEDPRLEAAMASVGPLLDDEIETQCAYCGSLQTVAFCLADFLSAALARERTLASWEVHYLARDYHWSRNEILALSRSSRREHVRMVLAEKGISETSWG